MIKRCCTCQTEKPFAEFHKNSAKLDGLHNQCKECRRAFYNANSDRILSYNRGWNDRNRDVIASHNEKRQMSIKGRAKQLWHGAKERAKAKGLKFDLTTAHIEVALLIGTCQRTGVRFDLSKHDRFKFHPFSPSVDKIDAFGDYTEDNVVIVCTAYNIGKHQMSHSEFVDFCRAVVEFNS